MIANFSFDTMIAHHTIFSEKDVPHDLAFIASTYTRIPFYKDDVKGEDNFALLPTEILRTYNCRDVLVTGIASSELDGEIDEYQVRATFEQDMKMLRPLLNMQRRGVLINRMLLEKKRSELQKEITEALADIQRVIGSDFKPSSTKQLQKFLFEDLGLDPIDHTKKGQPKVDFDSLIQLADQVGSKIEPLFHSIIGWRRAEKKLKNYYREFIFDNQGRVHPSYLIHVTPTGRLSARMPNVQNFPEHERDIFVPAPGYIFISRDFSQIELRILAIITQDESILQIFERGEDPHAYNACDLFGITLDKVTKQHRDPAKTFMYGGVIYGGTAETVRRQILSRALREGRIKIADIPSVAQVTAAQNRWFTKHPKIRIFQSEIEKEVLSTRRLRTPLGRVRYFLGRREDIVRAGYNFPIQGTASDIINPAFIELDKRIDPMSGGIVIQCHDELLLEVKKEEVNRYLDMSKEVMERPVRIHDKEYVFPTTVKTGYSWGTLEKVKE